MDAAVVMDSGTWQLRVGRAGEAAPRALQRTLVGRCKTPALGEAEGTALMVGEQVIAKADILTLAPAGDPLPVFEKNWHSALYARAHALPNRSPLCLVHSAFYGAVRPRFVEVLFEALAVPRLFFLDAGAAGIMSRGRVNGLSLDIGEAAAVVMPVFEGLAVQHEATVAELGGRAFRDEVRRAAEAPALSDFAIDSLRAEFYAHPRQATFTALMPDRSQAVIARPVMEQAARAFIGCLAALPRLAPLPELALQGGGALLPGLAEAMGAPAAQPDALRHAAWLGGSLFAAMDGAQSLFVNRAFYQEHGAEQVIAKNFQ